MIDGNFQAGQVSQKCTRMLKLITDYSSVSLHTKTKLFCFNTLKSNRPAQKIPQVGQGKPLEQELL